MPVPRKRKIKPWSIEEAWAFLESARKNNDLMYPAYVLVLVLGLRLGETLGLRATSQSMGSGPFRHGL